LQPTTAGVIMSRRRSSRGQPNTVQAIPDGCRSMSRQPHEPARRDALEIPGPGIDEDAMATVKSIPEGVQAVFPMLVCKNPEAEMRFCAAAFGAVEQVRRSGPDGSAIHIAMRINDAFLVVQSEFPDALASRAPAGDGSSPVVIFVYVADVDRAVEEAVAMGARILVPAQNQFWGDRTARIVDPSGHVWTVATRIEETTENQRAERWSDIRTGRQEE
jgi:PhnB protein